METKTLSRRNFIKLSALSGAMLAIGFYSRPESVQAEIMMESEAELFGIELNAWIHIDTAGKVTIFSHRAEMGQGVYQAIPQIIAEELEVNLDDVNIVFAQGDNKKYGNQVTGGSSTIRTSYKNLLKLSATAREMLIEAAATKWGVNKSDCYAEAGNIYHRPTGNKFHYGQLVEEASKRSAPKEVVLKKRSQYKLIGKPLRRQDTKFKTNGSATFGLDKEIPGMMYAAVERNPRLRGVVKSFDDTAARMVPGVQKVFKIRMGVFSTYREGVAVVATSTWAAMQGKKALKVEWDDSGFEHLNTEDIYKRMADDLNTKEGISFKTIGDPNSVIQSATKAIDVIYQTPYESHSCMEPVNCVAHWQGDKLEIWGPIREYIDRDLTITSSTACVLMSHNYDYDRDVLKKLMTTATPYIGMLGPRKRLDKMLDEFKTSGITFSAIDKNRIHAPIGLDIAAETPEEIAVSIIGEIQAKFHHREGGFLKRRSTTIHERDLQSAQVLKMSHI